MITTAFKLAPRPSRRMLRWNSSPGIVAWKALPTEKKDQCLKRLDDTAMSLAQWREYMRTSHQINFRTNTECSRAREIFNQEVMLSRASDRAETYERFIREKYEGLSDDDIRESVLSFIAFSHAGDDPKLAMAALKLGIDDDRFRLDRDKFEHLKAQAAKADATEKVLDAQLSDEERRLKIAQIFGRA